MRKLLTITLALSAFIVALACGSNDPEIDGTTNAANLDGLTKGTYIINGEKKVLE